MNGAAQTPVQVANGSATSATVTGLANGSSYTFTVSAKNAVGTSPDSAASNATVPQNTMFDFSTPATIDSGDGSALALGVKFTSDTAGSVTGIRFYKAVTNTGTHIGSLWTAAGQLLASATFTGETVSGWQTVTFASPVPITAGTTYVASYYAPNGHYSNTSMGLSSAVDNPPLHAVANGVSTNGVFGTGPSSTFPTSSFNATNYWVDVLFTQFLMDRSAARSSPPATEDLDVPVRCRRASTSPASPVVFQPVLFLGAGSIVLGQRVEFGWPTSASFFTGYCHVEASAPASRIEFGDGAQINNNAFIKSEGPGIRIGDRALVGSFVEIVDSDFHDLRPEHRRGGRPSMRPVVLGENVFIGDGAVILKGVTVGANSVIGAGSVVTGTIPDGVIAAGNPARVIREL